MALPQSLAGADVKSAARACYAKPFAPRGALERSHGWSEARAQPRERNPWSAGGADFSAPAGAAEAHASRRTHRMESFARLHFDCLHRPIRGEFTSRRPLPRVPRCKASLHPWLRSWTPPGSNPAVPRPSNNAINLDYIRSLARSLLVHPTPPGVFPIHPHGAVPREDHGADLRRPQRQRLGDHSLRQRRLGAGHPPQGLVRRGEVARCGVGVEGGETESATGSVRCATTGRRLCWKAARVPMGRGAQHDLAASLAMRPCRRNADDRHV